jgi:flavin reductase (DIM6/NTAB) family NADH-FMN oxidoreductase RutF
VGKKQIGPSTQLYPMPALLVAVRSEGERAAILTVAWAGIVGGQPPMMALEIGSRHYSTPFIEREGSFTVNVPRADMAAGVDYCGSVSGTKDPDKAATCGWTLAPSTQITSPMIAECPVNMECRVVRKIEAGQAQFYLAEILETHVDDQALDDLGHPTAQGINPLIFTPDGEYYALGAHLGKAWQIGRQLGK